MPLTGQLILGDIQNDFDAATTGIAAGMAAGNKDQTRFRRIAAMTAATALSARTIAWTQVDDQEARIMYGRGTTDGAATLTITLTAADGDTAFVLDRTLTAAVTAGGAGTVDTRPTQTSWRTTTGIRFRLLRGVRYRLTASVSAANWTVVMMGLQLRSNRRRA